MDSHLSILNPFYQAGNHLGNNLDLFAEFGICCYFY